LRCRGERYLFIADSNGGIIRQEQKVAFGRGSESKKASGLTTYQFAGSIELMILSVNPIDMVDTGRAKGTERFVVRISAMPSLMRYD
jgi:hypothetical protein